MPRRPFGPPRNDGTHARFLKLTLAYDGTRFVGWQRQTRGRSVQDEMEAALRRITGESIRVIGAGRTDAGVHAEGQVAHAVVHTRLAPAALQKAVNAILPNDILVRSLRVVLPGFHARYSAHSKHYRYTVWHHSLRPVFERDQVHHVGAPLNLAAMRRAAGRLRGRKDFAAFCSSGGSARSTVRHLRRLSIRRQGPKILIDVEADGFLYHMVRRIAGHLIEIGRGRSPAVAPTAPARGLCLLRVRYD